MVNWIEKALKDNLVVEEGEQNVAMDEDKIYRGRHFQGNLVQYQTGELVLLIVRYEDSTLIKLDKGACSFVVNKVNEFFKGIKFPHGHVYAALPPERTSVEVVIKSKKVFGYRTRSILTDLMKEL